MQTNTETRVMELMAMYVEHSLALDRLESLGRASPQTITDQRKQSHGMRCTLLRLASLLNGDTRSTALITPDDRALLGDTVPAPDAQGAAWIRKCLTPEGLAAMKNYHEATRPADYAKFGDPA
jgi:hypothetical protein